MATSAIANKGTAARKPNRKQRESKKKLKLVIFGFELLVILVMVGVLYLVIGATDEIEPIHVTELDRNNLGITDQVQEATETEGSSMYGYMNIALFGVDAKTENELFKSSRSDTIMIASINLDSGDIKLVSVYRDTYLNLGTDKYNKCNGAYSAGGAEQAVKMLNMNLDMDIKDFVTVGYAGLAEVIDGLGGVWIDVDKDELKHINNYQYSILGKYASKYITVPPDLNFTPDEYFKNYEVKLVTEPGYQRLNGLQATAYCRIRYVGSDFQRTERQREVIRAIEAQAKQASLTTLLSTFEKAAGDIYTSLSEETIKELLPKIADYRIVDEGAFPGVKGRVSVSMGAKGSCEVPENLTSSVVWLHKFLFDDEQYEVSDTVKEISNQILKDARVYNSSIGQ